MALRWENGATGTGASRSSSAAEGSVAAGNGTNADNYRMLANESNMDHQMNTESIQSELGSQDEEGGGGEQQPPSRAGSGDAAMQARIQRDLLERLGGRE